MKTLISLIIILGLATLTSCKKDNTAEPDNHSNKDGFYYAEVFSPNIIEINCGHAEIIIPDTTGLNDILGHGYNLGYNDSMYGLTHLFKAVCFPDSIADVGSKIRLKLRKPSKFELDSLDMVCKVDYGVSQPRYIMVTEIYKVYDN